MLIPAPVVRWLCKFEQCRGPRTWGRGRCHSDLHPSIMAAAHLLSNSVTRVSSDSDLPTSGEPEGPPVPDEVSPLLKPKRTQAHRQTISEWWRTAQSSFLNDNSGLLSIAASQLFFSAIGVAIKWLNCLDDPVPTLEVCLMHHGRVFFPRPDRFPRMRS